MTRDELSDIVESTSKTIFIKNKESIAERVSELKCSLETGTDFDHALASLLMLSANLGATVSLQTLIDLGYLTISE